MLHPAFSFGKNFSNDAALLLLERPAPSELPTLALVPASANALDAGALGAERRRLLLLWLAIVAADPSVRSWRGIARSQLVPSCKQASTPPSLAGDW